MIVAVLALAAVLAGPVPPEFQGRELDRLPTTRKEVVLTIDAGGNAVGGWSMLTKRKEVAATFFLTGRFVVANPALARAIGRTYPVANHTWSHLHLSRLSNAGVESEILRAERAIRARTGRDPRPIFRFPYGDRDARSIAIANRLGYVSVRWTVDTLGWMPGQTTAGAVRRVVDRLQPGAIVLMHVGAARDGSTVDARALSAVIDAIRRRGYAFTTFERLRPRMSSARAGSRG
jgi:peptidoglycan-N-acetylglucosamine deacetylase